VIGTFFGPFSQLNNIAIGKTLRTLEKDD